MCLELGNPDEIVLEPRRLKVLNQNLGQTDGKWESQNAKKLEADVLFMDMQYVTFPSASHRNEVLLKLNLPHKTGRAQFF